MKEIENPVIKAKNLDLMISDLWLMIIMSQDKD